MPRSVGERMASGHDVKTAIKQAADLEYLSMDERENALLQ